MKGTPPPATVEAFNEDTGSHDSSTESDDEDKLVIDLDPNTVSAAATNSSATTNLKMSTTNMDSKKPEAKPVKQEITSSTEEVNGKDQFAAPVTKSGEANTPTSKPKGKRGGNKNKSNENKLDSNINNAMSNGNSKSAKSDKNQKAGSERDSGKTTPAGKPGRKKKDKQLASVKTETSSTAGSDGDLADPYKFDQADEKTISSTTAGKHAKTKVKTEPVTTKDAQTEYDWRSVSTVTEPENLGPCEPGTQVCLEGIVWQETSNGVLVVNVTWKGKTYMGTLLDATKFDWSPPSCDSPVGDFEGRTPKGRGKRRVPLSDTFKDINERKLRKEQRQKSVQAQQPPPSPAKSDNGKRKGRSSECDNSEPTTKRGRAASRNSVNAAPPSPPSWECPEPNCGKKYKQMNGLRYHQRNAHQYGSPSPPASDTTSETDKPESVSSPDEPQEPQEPPRKSKRKSKAEKAAEKREAKVVTPKPEPVELGKDIVIPEKPLDSPPSTPAPTVAPAVTVAAAVPDAIRTNTTSVITPTTNTIMSVANTPPTSVVPVATITPQVVKPSSEDNSNSSSSSSINRPLAIAPPPKLISKPPNSSMAPISTITSPSGFNSTLKPIQPKPTILGESAPNPAQLQDLMDQKKQQKRKRSGSRDELTGTIPVSISNHMDLHMSKPPTTVHRFDNEHRGLLSNGGLINQTMDHSNILQSPSYSDISDEGELRRSREQHLLTSRSSDSNLYSQTQYPVATVSPQKNIPSLSDKDKTKAPMRRQTPSHSPAPSSSSQEEKHKQAIALQHMHLQQTLAAQSWPHLQPDLMQHMLQLQQQHQQQQQQQQHGAINNMSNKDKQSSSRSLSPKPSYKPSGANSREMDRASNERMQVLRESSSDMKQSQILPKPGSLNELPHDFSQNSRVTNDFMMLQQEQKNRELEQEHQKREMMRTVSPANKSSSMGQSGSKGQHDASSRQEKNAVNVPRSSPMPPPSFPGLSPFLANSMANTMANSMAASGGMSIPPFIQQAMLRGMPAAAFLQPGNFPAFQHMAALEQQSKEARNSVSPSMSSKPSHKIHELENRQSKSPRPSSSQNKSGPSGMQQQQLPPGLNPQLLSLGGYPGPHGMHGLFGPTPK